MTPTVDGHNSIQRHPQARAERLAAAVGTFVTVPPDVARYEIDVVAAAPAVRLSPAELEELATAGLPCRRDPRRGLLFDYDDLMNAVMFSGSGRSFPELAMRFQVRFAHSAESAWYESQTWLVTVRNPAPPPGGLPEAATRQYLLPEPDLAAPGVRLAPGHQVERGPDGYAAAVTLTGAANRIRDPRARRLWAELLHELTSGSVNFQSVPEPLRADPERAWQLGMADCMVAGNVLAGRLRQLGLEARTRRGYLLGLLGSEHGWCELAEDGCWKPLDLVFAFAAHGGRNRQYPVAPGFASACAGGRFNRLLPCVGDGTMPLVWCDGRPANPWEPARVSVKPLA
jgi:hypothetical protein